MFSNFTVHWNPLEGLFKEKFLDPVPKVPNSAGWGPRICISNKLSGDIAAAHLGSIVWGALMYCISGFVQHFANDLVKYVKSMITNLQMILNCDIKRSQ